MLVFIGVLGIGLIVWNSNYQAQKVKTAQELLARYEQNPVNKSAVSRAIDAVSADKRRAQLTARFNKVLSVDAWTDAVEKEAAQMISAANVTANAGKANMNRSTLSAEVAAARAESDYNAGISRKNKLKLAHNNIPDPGSQDIAGGEKTAYLFTADGAKKAAHDLTQSFLDEKTGYDFLIKAGFNAEDIQYGAAKVTANGITYSFKGMNGTGFEKSARGGVVGHYLMIANQNPAQRYNRFSVGIYYNVSTRQIFETVDFWLPNTQTVKTWQ
jgi:hypothetical protein